MAVFRIERFAQFALVAIKRWALTRKKRFPFRNVIRKLWVGMSKGDQLHLDLGVREVKQQYPLADTSSQVRFFIERAEIRLRFFVVGAVAKLIVS